MSEKNAERRDMTVGPEWKKILFFSLPIMAGQFLQQLYNTVDGLVVARLGGPTPEACEAALAAVGSTVSLLFLFLAVCIGLGNGGSVQIAQLFGAKRMDDVRRAASTQIITLTVLGLLFSVLGVIFARPLVTGLMGVVDPEILPMALDYFVIYAGGLVFVYTYNAVSGILRALGDSRATLYFLALSAGMNVVLDFVFVLTFESAVVGVAVATILSQFVCCIVSIVYMVKKYPIFRYTRKEFVFDRERFRISLKLGVPAIIQQAVISFGNIFIQRLVNGFGQATMSAFMVGNRMEQYVLVPIFGMNMGASTFAGQNVGAGKFDRVKRGRNSATIMAVGASIVLGALLFIFAPTFATLFNLTPEAFRQAVEFQRFMGCCLFIFASHMPTGGILQGSGDAMYMTMTSMITLSIRVLTTYALVYLFDYGYSSVWVTMPIGWFFGVLITWPRFYSGKWMNKGVINRERPTDGPGGGGAASEVPVAPETPAIPSESVVSLGEEEHGSGREIRPQPDFKGADVATTRDVATTTLGVNEA